MHADRARDILKLSRLHLHVVRGAAGDQVLIVGPAIRDDVAFSDNFPCLRIVGNFICPKNVAAVVNLRLTLQFVYRAIFFLLQGTYAVFIPFQRWQFEAVAGSFLRFHGGWQLAGN